MSRLNYSDQARSSLCVAVLRIPRKVRFEALGNKVAPGKAMIHLPEQQEAEMLRIGWMRQMGLNEDEITDSLRSDPPTSIEQEMTELLALERLKTKPSSEMLRKIAIKY